MWKKHERRKKIHLLQKNRILRNRKTAEKTEKADRTGIRMVTAGEMEKISRITGMKIKIITRMKTGKTLKTRETIRKIKRIKNRMEIVKF